ncbi:aldose 1-epimerase [Candidatus Latescibacterota bacterium]
MADVMFSYSITEDPQTGWQIVHLNAGNVENHQNNLSIKVAPQGGNHMFSFKAGSHELINAPDDLSEMLKRSTANPILYPTPNRVRNSEYTFRGETYKMSFPGETRSHMCHGLVWDDTAWNFSEPEVRTDAVTLKTWYVFDESNPRFPAYPFRNTLYVEYALFEDRLRISYEVENQDDNPLGFGFALHPFWNVIGSKEETRIQAALPYHMEATSDLLPTGKLEPVEETELSLLEPTPLAGLRLDDVYFGAAPDAMIRVIYDSIGLEIKQKATADFTHVVVYTPDRNYFCIENQTCSTDAHNLHSKGFERESHLQIVQPGGRTGGHVDFIISLKE